MLKKITPSSFNRRQFLTRILPAGSMLCLSCSKLLAFNQSQEETKAEKHKFKQKSNYTYEIVSQFSTGRYIPILQQLLDDIGKDKFIEMLKNASFKAATQATQQYVQKLPNRDFVIFKKIMNSPVYKNFWTFEIVEDTDKAFELKVSECIWAKTIRAMSEANATEIGWATVCYQDYPNALAFNPKLKLVRDKTLMQGHNYCNHRYLWEG